MCNTHIHTRTHTHAHTHAPACTHTHFFFVTPCPLRTSGRSQAERPQTCLQLKAFLNDLASLTPDCPGLEAVGCLAIVGRSWHPPCQPSQVQGVRCKWLERHLHASLEHGGPSLFAERCFLLAKILDMQAMVPLGAEEHIQQKQRANSVRNSLIL